MTMKETYFIHGYLVLKRYELAMKWITISYKLYIYITPITIGVKIQ